MTGTFIDKGLLHSITHTRNLHGYEEASTLDLHSVLVRGVPMYAMIQRRGTEVSDLVDLRRYSWLTGSIANLKHLVILWKVCWAGDTIDVIGDLGTTWSEYNHALENTKVTGEYRIVVRLKETQEELGFIYVNGYGELGIDRDSHRASIYSSIEEVEIVRLSLPMSTQPQDFKNTVNWLTDTYHGPIEYRSQRKAGTSWCDFGEINHMRRMPTEMYGLTELKTL